MQLINKPVFHQIGPLGQFDLVGAMSVCLCVCVSLFHVLDFEAYFVPTSQSCLSKLLEIRNPWGMCWKKVVSELNIFVGKCSKIAA